MAKRVRGSSTRPGQRAPLQRRPEGARPATDATSTQTGVAKSTSATVSPASGATTTASAASTSGGLTAAEEARAAALEAEIIAEERAVETRGQRRERSRRPTQGEAGVTGGAIAMSASQEYAYVARDVRRIVTIGGGLVVFLLGLWVVVAVTGIGPL